MGPLELRPFLFLMDPTRGPLSASMLYSESECTLFDLWSPLQFCFLLHPKHARSTDNLHDPTKANYAHTDLFVFLRAVVPRREHTNTVLSLF